MNSKKILSSLRREVETKVALGRYLRHLKRRCRCRRVAVCAEPDKLYDKPNRRKIMKINKTDENNSSSNGNNIACSFKREGCDKNKIKAHIK